ncbi:MAG: hypothetical protein SH868_18610 [Bythopirellula sp.]|nr:hypothetical protein [Bythopirellula sp.]
MRFRYASYEIEPSPTVPEGIVYRPEAIILVGGPSGTESIQALLDTGSDETVFPASLAKLLGVELNYGAMSKASAVGGHEVRLVPGQVTLELSQGDESYRWRSTVAFLETDEPEDEVALLGYAGFLEFFQATFDSETYEVTLLANNRFPRE